MRKYFFICNILCAVFGSNNFECQADQNTSESNWDYTLTRISFPQYNYLELCQGKNTTDISKEQEPSQKNKESKNNTTQSNKISEYLKSNLNNIFMFLDSFSLQVQKIYVNDSIFWGIDNKYLDGAYDRNVDVSQINSSFNEDITLDRYNNIFINAKVYRYVFASFCAHVLRPSNLEYIYNNWEEEYFVLFLLDEFRFRSILNDDSIEKGHKLRLLYLYSDNLKSLPDIKSLRAVLVFVEKYCFSTLERLHVPLLDDADNVLQTYKYSLHEIEYSGTSCKVINEAGNEVENYYDHQMLQYLDILAENKSLAGIEIIIQK